MVKFEYAYEVEDMARGILAVVKAGQEAGYETLEGFISKKPKRALHAVINLLADDWEVIGGGRVRHINAMIAVADAIYPFLPEEGRAFLDREIFPVHKFPPRNWAGMERLRRELHKKLSSERWDTQRRDDVEWSQSFFRQKKLNKAKLALFFSNFPI